MTRHFARISLGTVVLLVSSACDSRPSEEPSGNSSPVPPPPPVVPALASLGDGAGAKPRAATFSGGWAVAYDRPGMRSAFGIAGTGSKASDEAYDGWPHGLQWADSSSAGYGPEGGSGPNQLAYLRLTGQECLYNVWSRLGVPHLEYLLSQLRLVESASTEE